MPQKVESYKLETDEIFLYKKKIYVPSVQDLKLVILHDLKQCALCWAPWISENCGSNQEPLLLARYEERDF
jgi:hypothetical protein